jgi:SAM-dependent methyltransferase
MNGREVGRMWDENAEAWTQLARAGHDVYRDYVNTPAFFAMLPEAKGLCGLDIGCGEGHNTRLLAKRGTQMTGVDIAPRFVIHAKAEETHELQADDETVRRCPDMQDTQIMPYFLHIRCRKPR